MNFNDAQKLKPLRGACKRCKGWGYTAEESPYFREGKTIEQGSGCPRCLGNGIDPDWVDEIGELEDAA